MFGLQHRKARARRSTQLEGESGTGDRSRVDEYHGDSGASAAAVVIIDVAAASADAVLCPVAQRRGRAAK